MKILLGWQLETRREWNGDFQKADFRQANCFDYSRGLATNNEQEDFEACYMGESPLPREGLQSMECAGVILSQSLL